VPECVRWRATSNCSADGDRVPDKDRSCFEFVPDGESGFCECPGGAVTARSACEHEPLTCQRECRALRERRRRERDREKRHAGLATKAAPLMAERKRLFVIGAFGSTAGSTLDGFGLICSDGSRTALAGRPPQAEAHAWEFVCPGWSLCRDEDTTWDEVTKQPLCAAWAASGECAKNREYMRMKCARSCNACPDEGNDTALDADTRPPRMGVQALDVRGGLFVDAVRLRCAPEGAAGAGASFERASGRSEDELDGPKPGGLQGGREQDDGRAEVSEWHGGSGGDVCPLACDDGASWRVGGLVEGVVAAGGDKIDRIELTKCSMDLAL